MMYKLLRTIPFYTSFSSLFIQLIVEIYRSKFFLLTIPIGSMYGMFTCVWFMLMFMENADKYAIDGYRWTLRDTSYLVLIDDIHYGDMP